jgi:lipoprotein-anchoring transpeptidase ErfK/SrfK
LAIAGVALGAACSSSTGASAHDAEVVEPSLPTDGDDAAAAVEAPVEPGFPGDARTLRLKKSVSVHLEPSGDAKRIGTIARDIRVVWTRVADGAGCSAPWVEIAPRGWVCGSYLEPTGQPTYGVELPKLRRGELVPGRYGKVVVDGAVTFAKPEDVAAKQPKRTLAGSVKVRLEGEVAVGGVKYWKIGRDEILAASAVRAIEPSNYRGARLGDDTGLALPVAFAMPRPRREKRVPVYGDATSAKIVRWLEPRAAVPVLDAASSRLRIGDGAWVDAALVRVAEASEPPPLTGERERWVDVDVDRQTLVAYEGATPVYATLISSGSKKFPSETGIFRVWVKFAETDMNGQMGDDAPYSVATVPWTQFYAKDLALHTAYWHDKFGTPQSHGCINLSPVDARFLYFWTSPHVPEGWSMAHGIVEQPGSMVRVRSEADPSPALKGYAIRVHEARRARATP